MNIFRNLTVLLAFSIPNIALTETKFFQNVDTFSGADTSRVLIGGNNDEITIIIQCVKDELRLFFGHNELLGDKNDQVSIAYKLDDRAASEFHNSNLLNPTSLSLLGIKSSNRATNDWIKHDKALLGLLAGAKTLAIRIVDPHDNNTLTTEFSLKGLRDEVL